MFWITCRFEIKYDPAMEVVIDYAAREKEEKELLSKAMEARAKEISNSSENTWH